ncbi:MAG: Lrp/AsnC family transcriptional regulator [Marinobacterium sp.]|nr:Lrp/AsnC family transcriptional regulator [Marinobacterium sp.]
MKKTLKDNAATDLDSTDLQLLKQIQRDGRLSNTKLAEQINLSETPCWRRWKRLEEEGYIDGYRCQLNRQRLGFGVIAFVQVALGQHDVATSESFERHLQQLDWVLMCHNITGDADYLLQIIARDLEQFADHQTELRQLPGVRSIRSSIAVREVKADPALPLG